MRKAIRSLGGRLYLAAEQLNLDNMRRMIARFAQGGSAIDLGCGDGKNTAAIFQTIELQSIVGVEQHDARRLSANQRGIDAVAADLDSRLPFGDRSFDIVVSNQVIEHLAQTDLFVAEIFRILVPGGLAVVSTENMASWHNIAALVLGFAPFSAINYSNRIYPLGNPLSIHQGETPAVHEGMTHRRVFTTTALRALFRGSGFDVCAVAGSGYHPLPPIFGRIDSRHAHFVTLAARKPHSKPREDSPPA